MKELGETGTDLVELRKQNRRIMQVLWLAVSALAFSSALLIVGVIP